MLRRLDRAAAVFAYTLAAFWLAASSFFSWLAINGFGQDREVARPSITIAEHLALIGICLLPTLMSCALAMIAMRDRRPWSADVFGFAALLLILSCFGMASLWANHVTTSDI